MNRLSVKYCELTAVYASWVSIAKRDVHLFHVFIWRYHLRSGRPTQALLPPRPHRLYGSDSGSTAAARRPRLDIPFMEDFPFMSHQGGKPLRSEAWDLAGSEAKRGSRASFHVKLSLGEAGSHGRHSYLIHRGLSTMWMVQSKLVLSTRRASSVAPPPY